MARSDQRQKLRQLLEDDAVRLGFSDLRVTQAKANKSLRSNLQEFVAKEYHGTMAWLPETIDRRSSPDQLWSDAKSIIVLTMNYGPDVDPLINLSHKDRANISVYARNRDYHDVIKGRLKEIAGRFAAKTGEDVKVFVDTAPVMEKPIAQQAGIGWQGKHTNLVSRTQGSWFFLASIFTTAELDTDHAEIDHCGSCSACLDACPTNAFPAPYQIDARRCISYLTIEHKGPIDPKLRTMMGNRIYGCDDCLAACPWNKFAQSAHEMKLQAREDLIAPDIQYFLSFDDAQFRTFFSGSPIKRIGRDRFIRNVLIAAGNSGDLSLAEHCKTHLKDPNEIVRGSAVWALSQLLPTSGFAEIASAEMQNEASKSVLNEWQHASA